MDENTTSALIERHLELMNATPIKDDASAHQALAYAMSAVSGMTQGLGANVAMTPLVGNPVDDVIDKLEDWIKRLVAKLTEIAKQLKASFSISVGTGVSVTISCGPFN